MSDNEFEFDMGIMHDKWVKFSETTSLLSSSTSSQEFAHLAFYSGAWAMCSALKSISAIKTDDEKNFKEIVLKIALECSTVGKNARRAIIEHLLKSLEEGIEGLEGLEGEK